MKKKVSKKLVKKAANKTTDKTTLFLYATEKNVDWLGDNYKRLGYRSRSAFMDTLLTLARTNKIKLERPAPKYV